MKILSEAISGDFGFIFWYEMTNHKVSEKDLEKMRQKSISEVLNSTITNMMYEPGKAIQTMEGVIQRGWDEANQQKKLIESSTEVKKEIFLIGDPNTVPRIIEIETDPNFRGWSNPLSNRTNQKFKNRHIIKIMKTEKIPARILTELEDGTKTWICNVWALTENELVEQGNFDFDDKEDPTEEAKWISVLLEDAKKSGLETEVIQFSLKFLREDPRLTPAMAFRLGYLEWIK